MAPRAKLRKAAKGSALGRVVGWQDGGGKQATGAPHQPEITSVYSLFKVESGRPELVISYNSVKMEIDGSDSDNRYTD